jgi:N-methylhydantoinase A
MKRDLACRLGVDVGGTFTDLVLLTRDGRLVTRKVLSTSGNYAEAIFAGIADVLQEAGIAGGNVKELIHGTTVATNAIIERRGARTGLVTTEGFRNLLEIGRLRLMRLYDMDQERPTPWCAGAGASKWPNGSTIGVPQAEEALAQVEE